MLFLHCPSQKRKHYYVQSVAILCTTNMYSVLNIIDENLIFSNGLKTETLNSMRIKVPCFTDQLKNMINMTICMLILMH